MNRFIGLVALMLVSLNSFALCVDNNTHAKLNIAINNPEWSFVNDFAVVPMKKNQCFIEDLNPDEFISYNISLKLRSNVTMVTSRIEGVVCVQVSRTNAHVVINEVNSILTCDNINDPVHEPDPIVQNEAAS